MFSKANLKYIIGIGKENYRIYDRDCVTRIKGICDKGPSINLNYNAVKRSHEKYRKYQSFSNMHVTESLFTT
jgi:hypothetical protein